MLGGTVVPTPALASYDCDGTGDNLAVAFVPFSAYPGSISIWVKDNTQPENGVIVAIGTSGSNNQTFLIRTSTETPAALVRTTNDQGTATAGVAIGDTTTWHHILASFASTSLVSIWLDGDDVGTVDPIDNVPTGMDVLELCDRPDGADGIAMKVAELAIWDVALDGTDAADLAACVAPATVNTMDLQGYWPLAADPNDDVSTNHLTVTNADLDTMDNPCASAAPEIDSGPTCADLDGDTIRCAIDANDDTDEIHCALYALDTGTQTGADIEAGTGAHGSTAGTASTGSSQDIDIDVTDDPPFPAYDVQCAPEEGSANYGPVAADDDTYVTPSVCGDNDDEDCQNIDVTSIAAGGLFAWISLGFDGQTVDFAVTSDDDDRLLTGGTTGSVMQIIGQADGGAGGTLYGMLVSGSGFMDDEDLTSVNGGAAVVDGTETYYVSAADIMVVGTQMQPCLASASIDPDGLLTYSGCADDRQSLLGARFYDRSAEDWLDDWDMANEWDYWINNKKPACSDGARSLVLNQMLTIDLGDTYCEDDDDPVMSSVAEVASPMITGGVFSDPDLVITPTVPGESGTGTYRATDIAGDYDDWDLALLVARTAALAEYYYRMIFQ